MKFTEFNLDEKILQGVEDAGFDTCTQVQAESYPHTLQGKDVLVQSQTGSGKTAAFLIPAFNNLLKNGGKALIIAPTRELAIQIMEEAKTLGKHLKLKSACFFGGTGYVEQEAAIKAGVDIAIGTPGRLLDFGKSGKIKFNEFTQIIIDEADRLFDMGFYPDIQAMMKKALKPNERQTMLFSATLSLRVRQLAWEYMNRPEEVEIESDNITVEEIDQTVYHVSSNEKMKLLLGLLKKYDPKTVLIFTNTKYQAAALSQKLNYNNYKSIFISGDLPQKKRLSAINKIKNGEVSILTATDVAARGLHIEDLPLVINYDIPEDFEVYVHRIGRTARAGKTGKAITLACEKFVYHLDAIEDYINSKIPVAWVEDSLLQEEDLSIGKPIELPGDRGGNRDRRNNNGRRDSYDSNKGNSNSNRKPVSRSRQAPDQNRSTISNEVKQDLTQKKAPISRKKSTATTSRPNKKSAQNNQRTTQKQFAKKPDKQSTQEERMAYYRQKYGESFGSTAQKQKTGNRKKQTNKGKESSTHNNPANKRKPIMRMKTTPAPKKAKGLKALFQKFKRKQ